VLKTLKIDNLRGISSGVIEDLAQVNVLVGPNNAGKSTILDALLFVASPNPTTALGPVLTRRHLNNPSLWLLHRNKGKRSSNGTLSVTSDKDDTRQVILSASYQDTVASIAVHVWPEEKEITALQKKMGTRPTDPAALQQWVAQQQGWQQKLNDLQQKYNLKQQQGEIIPGTPEVHLIEPDLSKRQTSLADLYTLVAERGLRKQAKEIVTDLIPEVEDIEILTQNSQPVVYLDLLERGALPVELAGEGVQLLLVLSFELARPSGGLVLLEEPETHLHPAAIRQAARAVRAAADREIQAVITTHSLDLIDSLLEVFNDSLDLLAFYRVKLDNGELISYRLSGEKAAKARTEISEDLR